MIATLAILRVVFFAMIAALAILRVVFSTIIAALAILRVVFFTIIAALAILRESFSCNFLHYNCNSSYIAWILFLQPPKYMQLIICNSERIESSQIKSRVFLTIAE